MTGLPNRLLFVDLLDRAIKRTQRRPDELFAILILGLDRFKAVSDSLGPLTADRLLVAVAGRLQAALSGDRLRCGRGSRGSRSRDSAATSSRSCSRRSLTPATRCKLAERLRSTLQEPFDIDGHQLFTSATVGIAVSTTGLRRVRRTSCRTRRSRCIAPKAEAATSCELFDPAMRERAVSRLRMETDLRHAIERQEFEVDYQPIISLTTGRSPASKRWRAGGIRCAG